MNNPSNSMTRKSLIPSNGEEPDRIESERHYFVDLVAERRQALIDSEGR